MKRILLIPPKVQTVVSRDQGRVYKIALLILVFVTALYTKEYKGDYQAIIASHVGGVLYVLFGSLLFSVFFPRLKNYIPVLMAFGITCLLEFIQYFRIPFMLELTKIKIFAYLFGNSFNWYDFLYYILGAALGFAVLFLLTPRATMNK